MEQEFLAYYGYDAAKGEYVDMVTIGIIDPLKVTSTASVYESSASFLLTTSEVVVFKLQNHERPSPTMGACHPWVVWTSKRIFELQ